MSNLATTGCNSGIYKIINLIDGNLYIGLSTNLKRRKFEHFCNKNVLKKTNILYRAMRKYSKENFLFEVIEYVTDLSRLSEREVYWIEVLNPKYNMNLGGLGNKGYSVSEETKDVLRKKAKMQWELLTDEEKRLRILGNLKGPQKGHEVSAHTRQKLRDCNLGKKKTEESKLKLSNSQKVSMKGNSNRSKKIIGVSEINGVISFNSAKEAGLHFNRHPSAIINNLKGKIKHAFGYKWEYLNKSI